MKVKELIAELQKYDGEYEADTEGGDHIGQTCGVVRYREDSVLIIRSTGLWLEREEFKDK